MIFTRFFVGARCISSLSDWYVIGKKVDVPSWIKPQAEKTRPPKLKELTMDHIVNAVEKSGGRNIVVMDLRGRSAHADFMVVSESASANLRKIASSVRQLMKQGAKANNSRIVGAGDNWVAFTFSNVSVHCFTPKERRKYFLEKLWGLVGSSSGRSM